MNFSEQYKAYQNNRELMLVVKQANTGISYLIDGFKGDGDLISHYIPFYEKAKNCIVELSFHIFFCICLTEIKYLSLFHIKP